MTPPVVVPVRKFVADAGERVAWTFVETFAGALAVTAVTGSLSLSAAHAAAIAGAAATLTVVKALAAARLGSTGTAATLPADLDPANHPAVLPAPVVNIFTPPATTGDVANVVGAVLGSGAEVTAHTNSDNGGDPTSGGEALAGELGLDQPIDPAPPAPGTSSLPPPPSSPPVEALAHVDPPEVPPAPSATALGARAERDKAAAEARAAKKAAKRPAKKATPATSTSASSGARKKAAAKKASTTRKRSR